MGSEDEIPLKPHAGHEGVAIKRPTDHVLLVETLAILLGRCL